MEDELVGSGITTGNDDPAEMLSNLLQSLDEAREVLALCKV